MTLAAPLNSAAVGQPVGRKWGPIQLLTTLIVCAAAWAVVAAACLCIGSTEIGWPGESLARLRADNVLIASLVGAALAASGVTYQAVLRNPLADPYLLGVSSG